MITPEDFANAPKPMSADEQQAVNAYANLMAEVRDRTLAIQEIFSEEIELSNQIRLEFAYLQIRMILETVALSCLVAHGDLKEVKASQLQKAYQADFIVKRLEKLHPDFFPIPHISASDGGQLLGGRQVYHFAEAEGERLTKAELVSMYAKAGARLHRGSLKTLSKAKADQQAELDGITDFVEKIIALLGDHHIMTRDRQTVFLCAIPEKSVGEVTVHFAAVSGNRGTTPGRLAIAEQVVR